MKTTRTPECKCPHCGHVIDSASYPKGNEAPSPLDYSVCIECGGLCRFDTDLTLVKANMADAPAYVQVLAMEYRIALAGLKR